MATHQQDQLTVVNPTDEPFTVRWNGNPYTLPPKKQTIWPRFLAEHFAKHLTDSILLKREEEDKRLYRKGGRPMSEYIAPALLNNRKVRPKVVDSIILGVFNYYTPQGTGAADQIQQQIDQWNQQPAAQPQERVTDMGAATDPLLGVLEDDDDDEDAVESTPPVQPADPTPTEAVENALGTTPAAIVPPMPVTPTVTTPVAPISPAEKPLAKRNRLMKEAKQLGIRGINPSSTSEWLENEIKKTYA